MRIKAKMLIPRKEVDAQGNEIDPRQELVDKILEYKSNLAGKDMQDFVSMAMLWFATEQTKNSTTIINNKDIEDELNSIEQFLTKSVKVNL